MEFSRRQALRLFGGLVGSLAFGESSLAQQRGMQQRRFSREEIIPSEEEFGIGVVRDNDNNDTVLKQKIRLIYQNPGEALKNLSDDEKNIYNQLYQRYYPPKREVPEGFLAGFGQSLGQLIGEGITFQYNIRIDCEEKYGRFRNGLGNVIRGNPNNSRNLNGALIPFNPSTADLIVLTMCKKHADYYDINKLELEKRNRVNRGYNFREPIMGPDGTIYR